jgi:hypothetical protein
MTRDKYEIQVEFWNDPYEKKFKNFVTRAESPFIAYRKVQVEAKRYAKEEGFSHTRLTTAKRIIKRTGK